MSLRRKSLRKNKQQQPSDEGSNNSKMANGGSTDVARTNTGLFWDIGNYRRTVKRIDEGAFTCDELVRMVSERAEIEAKYAKRLTMWEEKWRRQIENGPLYNTTKSASLGVLEEAQQRASIHMDCWAKLQNQVVESVKTWKAQNYRKNFMGGWKETKEIDDQFVKAQKPWSEAYIKVQKAKRNFHSASKAHETASQTLSAQSKDGNVPPEKIKKLEDAVARHAKNVERMKIKYEEKLLRIDPLNSTYEQEMTKVFEKCQFMEEKRLNFLQDMLVEYHKCLNVNEDERLGGMFRDQLQKAYSADVKQDLQYFAETYGADMPRNWPKFEEFKYGFSEKYKAKKRSLKNGVFDSRVSSSEEFTRDFSVTTMNIDLLDKELMKLSKEDISSLINSNKQTRTRDGEFSAKDLIDLKTESMLHRTSSQDTGYRVYREFYGNVKKISVSDSFFSSRSEEQVFSEASSKKLAAVSPLYSCHATTSLDEIRKLIADLETLHGDVSSFSGAHSGLKEVANSSQKDCSLERKISAGGFGPQTNKQSIRKEYGTTSSTPSLSDGMRDDIDSEPSYATPVHNPPLAYTNPAPDVEEDSNPFLNGPGDSADDEWDEPPPAPEIEGDGLPVRCLYDYSAVEDDELTFQAGDILIKLSEEDEQGWCRGKINGKEGLFPANYVEAL